MTGHRSAKRRLRVILGGSSDFARLSRSPSADAVAPGHFRQSLRVAGSGGGAQGVEQATNVRGGHADTAVGGTIGEAHVVTVAVCSLDEHDVVHVAPALPVELRLEEWLGKWCAADRWPGPTAPG